MVGLGDRTRLVCVGNDLEKGWNAHIPCLLDKQCLEIIVLALSFDWKSSLCRLRFGREACNVRVELQLDVEHV